MKIKLESIIEKARNEYNMKNIEIAKWSMKPIWGGASLLKVHLKLLKDLIEMKHNNIWDWDYFINLSESDFPIK